MKIKDIIDFEIFNKINHGDCYEDIDDLRDDIREFIKTDILDQIDDFADDNTAETIYDAATILLHKHYCNKYLNNNGTEDDIFSYIETTKDFYNNLI